MFAYAFIMGVKYGWLSVKEYGEAARRGLVGNDCILIQIVRIREVCVGTNKKMICNIIMTEHVIQVIIMAKLHIFGVLLLYCGRIINFNNQF